MNVTVKGTGAHTNSFQGSRATQMMRKKNYKINKVLIFIDYYSVIRDCTGFGLDSFIRKQCPPNTITNEQGNYTYFSYGSSCCQWFRSTRTDTESMICQCQTDNCNGVLPHRMPNAGDMPSTIANRISAQSTIAQRKSSDGFSPQPIGKLSIVFVAMIAVLSIIRWYI